MSVRLSALHALQTADLEQKTILPGKIHAQSATLLVANEGSREIRQLQQAIPAPANLPGRPTFPQLVDHMQIRQKSPHTRHGLAALIHAVCHIEFNAINLALDAVWRFAGMPPQYYVDWLRVAKEEAHHFSLLRAQLQSLGYDYGDFPAHNGLWSMAERTQHDIIARMALVPRLLEARGLDATPPMQQKLRKVGSAEAMQTVQILDLILRDEIGHVKVGNHWYRWLCERDDLEPVAHFRKLCREHAAPKLRAPINLQARRLAGFSDEELRELLEA